MNKKYTYLLTIYFANKSNVQATLDSNKAISKFTNNFNRKVQKNNIKFWNFIGGTKKMEFRAKIRI